MADQKQDDVSEDELDQIIADMSEEETKDVSAPAPAKLREAPKSSALPEQTLSMELQGVINLKLCFSNGERSIEVRCTEEALVCRMADGTEFRIPTGARKRSAA